MRTQGRSRRTGSRPVSLAELVRAQFLAKLADSASRYLANQASHRSRPAQAAADATLSSLG